MSFTRKPLRLLPLLALLFCVSAADAPAQDAGADKDEETVKVDTNLVSMPVIVMSRGGSLVPDMRKEEFAVEEDGVKQEVAFFASVTRPFRVVLMLDTSASAEEKMGLIRRAALSFVEQLQPGDRVKVISFDDEVRDHNEFTGDKEELRRAIDAARPGKGTKLYDAVQLAFQKLRRFPGRKAIVLFTDGVDYRSVDYRDFHNLRALEESDVVVYPIRYDTRAETERLARAQAAGPSLADVVRGRGSSGGVTKTPTTFPGEDEGGGAVGVLSRLPSVMRPAPQRDPTRDTSRGDPTRDPGGGGRNEPIDGMPRDPRTGGPARSDPSEDRRGGGSSDDGIGRMLDVLYKTADAYLEELARKSGGKLVRADTLAQLPAAFKEIADELRTQYSIGYYPTRPVSEGRYRKVRVRTTRKDAVVRARPGYTATRPAGR